MRGPYFFSENEDMPTNTAHKAVSLDIALFLSGGNDDTVSWDALENDVKHEKRPHTHVYCTGRSRCPVWRMKRISARARACVCVCVSV